MKKETQHKYIHRQSWLLLMLTAVLLTCLGCQKTEEPAEKTVSAETLATTYQTEVTELLEQALTATRECGCQTWQSHSRKNA